MPTQRLKTARFPGGQKKPPKTRKGAWESSCPRSVIQAGYACKEGKEKPPHSPHRSHRASTGLPGLDVSKPQRPASHIIKRNIACLLGFFERTLSPATVGLRWAAFSRGYLRESQVLGAPPTSRLRGAPALRSLRSGLCCALLQTAHPSPRPVPSLQPPVHLKVPDHPSPLRRGHRPPTNLLLLVSSVQSLGRIRLCDPMNHSTPGLPVHHQLPESTQTHVHRVGDAIQPSHPLSSPSPAPNPSQH